MANIEDTQKALACIEFLFEAVSDPQFSERYQDENAECRRRLGAGWNFMTVMQWMSWKKAVAAINAFSDEVTLGQLHGQQLMFFFTIWPCSSVPTKMQAEPYRSQRFLAN